MARDGKMSIVSFPSNRWILVHLHITLCIDSQRPKRDNNEHIAVERAVLFRTVT
jgi:hypothetical protein